MGTRAVQRHADFSDLGRVDLIATMVMFSWGSPLVSAIAVLSLKVALQNRSPVALGANSLSGESLHFRVF